MNATEPHTLRSLVDPDQMPAAENALHELAAGATSPHDPLVLRLLLALASWVASGFLYGFVAVAFGFNDVSAMTFGLLVMVVCIIIHQRLRPSHFFFQQFLLATMICGHLVALFGFMMQIGSSVDRLLILASTQTLLSLVTIPLFARGAYQAGALLLSITFWILTILEADAVGIYHALLLAQTVALAAIVLAFSRRSSIAYALAVSLGASIFLLDWMQSDLWRSPISAPLWPANLSLVLFTAALGYRLVPRQQWLHPTVVTLTALLILLTFLSTPGLLFALNLLLLGYALRDAVFLAIGLTALPVFLVFFYYTLQISLLEKSGILLASGLVCLLIAWLARRHLESNTPDMERSA